MMTNANDDAIRADVEPVIRAMSEADHPAMHELLTSTSVIDATMRIPHAAMRETAARLAPRPGAYHLVADVDGRAVGVAELITYPDEPRHRHVGELNLIAVDRGWSGRGVGCALMRAVLDLADDWLQLTRLGLVVFVDNTRAIRLYEGLGFVVEGTSPAYAFRRGRFVDAHVMGRVRDAAAAHPTS
jgi:L-phenylalanine/L-methionine N-acetyltransferase